VAKRYAINVENLHKSFGKLKVLEGVDLQVNRGTIVALLGPNGAGKTTTVRILATLLRPDSGTATIEGYDVVKDADEVRSLIGLTGQYAAVDEYLTGRENLRMMGRLYHLSKADTVRRGEELLEQFDLVDAADRTAKTYSGGMRRRLDLAASLIATPPIIFLDEPTTGLDPRSRLAMWDIIQELVKQGTTILLTTQHLEEADRLADFIVVIDEGKIIARGTADELKSKVGRERIRFMFDSDKELKKAVKVIDESDGLEVDEKQKSLSVSNDKGVYKLRQLLDGLEKAKVNVTGMSLSKPTLDDVFLKLTGHKAITNDTQEYGHAKKETKV
jgi:ABC-2 type transport system ATP-binding protein